MQYRRPMIVAAFTGLFLVGIGGCARSETSLRQQNGENDLSRSQYQGAAAANATWQQGFAAGAAATGRHGEQTHAAVATSPFGRPGNPIQPPRPTAYRTQLQVPGRTPGALNQTQAMPKRLPPPSKAVNQELADSAPNDPTTSDGAADALADHGLDTAFQRLHEAREKMPRHLPAATTREVSRPAARVASPFVRSDQHQPSSVR